jgi:anti-sigma B factor antagonist
MSYLSEFSEKGIQIVLFGVSDKVKNVFSILGLDELITIVSTKESAMEKLAQ